VVVRKRRIILYDDQKIILKALEDFFVVRGYEVISCDIPVVCPMNGRLRESCRKGEACADIIMSDYTMPGMNGFDLLQTQERQGCRVPIHNKALMSAYIDDNSLHMIKKAGYMFFPKPFDLKQIDKWLASRELHMDLSQPLRTGVK
jgi:DNA-binding NtrC family response regulator